MSVVVAAECWRAGLGIVGQSSLAAQHGSTYRIDGTVAQRLAKTRRMEVQLDLDALRWLIDWSVRAGEGTDIPVFC